METEAFIENLLGNDTVVSEGTLEKRDYLHNLLDNLRGGYIPLRHSAVAPDLLAGAGPVLDPSAIVAPRFPLNPKPPSPPVKTQGSAPDRSRSPLPVDAKAARGIRPSFAPF